MRPGRPEKLPPHRQARLVAFYRQGYTANQLLWMFGIHRRTLYRILERSGVELRRPQKHPRQQPTPRLYACPVCGGRSADPSGHPTCTHGRAA